MCQKNAQKEGALVRRRFLRRKGETKEASREFKEKTMT
jgi:hypothetical protein